MFGSAFGQSKPAGGLFGSSTNTNTQQTSGGLFGGLGQNAQQNQPQQTGGLFGGLGQSTQQQPQQGGGLFGSTQNQQQPQQSGGLFGGLGQNTQQQQGGGLGQSTQQSQPQQGGLFGGGLGQSQQAQPQQGGLFGGLGQSQQPQQQSGGLFGQSTQQQNPSQLGSSLWQPNSLLNPREKSVEDQMTVIAKKWITESPECAFRHYFYNKKENENEALYAKPEPREDPKAWEDALLKKPGPGFYPSLCVGFKEIGDRIKIQQWNLTMFNAHLHKINEILSGIMQDHETKTSIRALDARRKHVVLKQRCLALATKVQVLRNRGYAMAGDEEDLRSKLMSLDKVVSDPGLGARGEEIWARMLIVQERANILKREIERSGTDTPAVLNEEMSRRAKKILEDYYTQLQHLRAEIEQINQEFVDWQKEQALGSSRA